jgi:hypothetical protein
MIAIALSCGVLKAVFVLNYYITSFVCHHAYPLGNTSWYCAADALQQNSVEMIVV